MPLYEYDCPQCGRFEINQKMTDDRLRVHDCGKPVERLISLSSFALKGGGWYSDGYASTACSPQGCAKPACSAKAEA